MWIRGGLVMILGWVLISDLASMQVGYEQIGARRLGEVVSDG